MTRPLACKPKREQNGDEQNDSHNWLGFVTNDPRSAMHSSAVYLLLANAAKVPCTSMYSYIVLALYICASVPAGLDEANTMIGHHGVIMVCKLCLVAFDMVRLLSPSLLFFTNVLQSPCHYGMEYKSVLSFDHYCICS